MAYFNYQSYKLYYEEMGEGTPLFLLHGNTASSVMFQTIAPIYAKTHKVILLDFLGCGKSDRRAVWPIDLWYDQALQVIAFSEANNFQKIHLIGTSGGALTAINVALERPELVQKLIADSFEGEHALADVTENLRAGREASKQNPGARMFYESMHGADWQQVVDADTEAVLAHAQQIGHFFHHPLAMLQPELLFTGSNEDEFVFPGYFETLFSRLLKEIGHGEKHIFPHGNHPAMLSNAEEFIALSNDFFIHTGQYIG